jgi:CBS domain containing-hemolysin-like protein
VIIELIIAASLALILSAGCSLCEAVLYSVPMRQIEAYAQAGKPAWKRFKQLRTNVERPIAAILSLNTIANTTGAAIAGSAAAAVFGYDRVGYFSALFTLAILFFSEIIPKTTGVVFGKSLVGAVAYPLWALTWLMTPLTFLTGLVTRLVFRGKVDESVTAEEIRVMARLSLQTGGIKPFQEEAIRRVLTLQQKIVRDVMTPRTVVFSLSEHLTLEEASKMTGKWEHSRWPVYGDDPEDVVGIVLTKEFFMALTHGKKDMKLTELMRPVHFVVETARLNRVLLEFLELRQHLFVVLDEYGGLAGVITLEDILEEILGREIIDESDEVVDKRELARQRRNRIIAKGPSAP